MIFSKKTILFFVISIITLILISYFFFDKAIALYFIKNKDIYEHTGDILSIAGQSHWYIGTGVLGYLFFKYYKQNEFYKQRFLFLFYVNIFSGLISLISKFIFARIRPWGLRDGQDHFGFILFQNFDLGLWEKLKFHIHSIIVGSTANTSFPSGHTTTIFAMFTYLSLLFPKYIYAWLLLAIVFSSARILDSDHFLSDILGGILVGTLSSLYIYSKMRGKLEKNS